MFTESDKITEFKFKISQEGEVCLFSDSAKAKHIFKFNNSFIKE